MQCILQALSKSGSQALHFMWLQWWCTEKRQWGHDSVQWSDQGQKRSNISVELKFSALFSGRRDQSIKQEGAEGFKLSNSPLAQTLVGHLLWLGKSYSFFSFFCCISMLLRRRHTLTALCVITLKLQVHICEVADPRKQQWQPKKSGTNNTTAWLFLHGVAA